MLFVHARNVVHGLLLLLVGTCKHTAGKHYRTRSGRMGRVHGPKPEGPPEQQQMLTKQLPQETWSSKQPQGLVHSQGGGGKGRGADTTGEGEEEGRQEERR